MRRVAFLFDGFNLYHSLSHAKHELGSQSTLWLDLWGLSRSLLREVGGGAELASVHYFSALAGHVNELKPGATTRHMTYIDALRSTGVTVELGQFKQKWSSCSMCGAKLRRFEEKETDVAIATRLLELLWTDRCDAAVLVSADSDLAPALRTAERQFPERPVYVCFPYARGTHELRLEARRVFRLRKERYAANQLPDPVVMANGREIRKPASW